MIGRLEHNGNFFILTYNDKILLRCKSKIGLMKKIRKNEECINLGIKTPIVIPPSVYDTIK